MPLTGQAKTDYQCAYMRTRRSNKSGVRPKPALDPTVRPKHHTRFDEALAAEAEQALMNAAAMRVDKPLVFEPQSDNPMAVGYVPKPQG